LDAAWSGAPRSSAPTIAGLHARFAGRQAPLASPLHAHARHFDHACHRIVDVAENDELRRWKALERIFARVTIALTR
jgi:hypothetical protein